MDLEYIRDYCLLKSGVEECFPFDQDTLVFKVMGKIFAIIPLERLPLQINLKCDPEKAIALREENPDCILPGYHMNKTHWNTVILESDLPQRLIQYLVNHSYELVVSKLTKKLKEKLKNIKQSAC